ncbi:SH3 domain-containing protein [Clostridium manihotivorum]|uniref:Ligand-binding protein SH3 n=1 Tax=Clostridium manihotivorum TaxID=2320868 RepID=A0A3R5UFM6_9CLOT|nr:SH3 domain-containing protein [Clostridium manihotivorum]QAA32534.1 ligand-binding protein SH3 [Clostridium manihotivorum]
MRFEVIEEHRYENNNPLIVKRGTRIKVVRRSNWGDGWINWAYCCTMDGTSEGWAPEQIIQIENEEGVFLEDYSAKEFNVEKGSTVKGTIELNGWIWCISLDDTESGWLPKDKLKALKGSHTII